MLEMKWPNPYSDFMWMMFGLSVGALFIIGFMVELILQM